MNNHKTIIFNEEARAALKRGVDAVADSVKVTLGAKGRNVIISKQWGSPTITKDGVTVAKEITLENPIENMGAQMIIDVASKTADMAGDGTTTATVLAQVIISEGMKNVTAGANPMSLKKGIDKAVEAIVSDLKKQSKPIGNDHKNVEDIATISANNDHEIGKLIAMGMKKVGKNGVLTIEESKSIETHVDIVQGMQFDRGMLNPYFVTDIVRSEAVLINPYILMVEKTLSSFEEILPITEKVTEKGRPLFVMAENVDGGAIAFLVTNKMKNSIQACAVKLPFFGVDKGSVMEDIAAMTGGTYITEAKGFDIKTIELGMLGSAKKVIVTKNSTTIQDGEGAKENIQERIDSIKQQLKENPNMAAFEKEKLMTRIGKLVGGIGVIYVGGATEVELKEKKYRVEDALYATKAAVEEGVVPGGGVAYIKSLAALGSVKGKNRDEDIGIDIIRKSITEPLLQMVRNSGSTKAEIVLEKLIENFRSPDYGYNCLMEKYENFFKTGVLDPTKVSRVALENAASIAGLMLTTECLICLIPDKQPQQNQ